MTEAEIKQVLLDCQASFYPVAPGFAAIPLSAVEDQGADLEEVVSWVDRAGGHMAEAQVVRSATPLAAGRMTPRATHSPVRFLAVPRIALGTSHEPFEQ